MGELFRFMPDLKRLRQTSSVYAKPKPIVLRGAKNGRTFWTASSVRHFTTGAGHVGRGHGAGGGHLVGSGHITSGQRGRGHGGHSPLGFWHLLQSSITG